MTSYEIISNICLKQGLLSDDVIDAEINQGNIVTILNALSLVKENVQPVFEGAKMLQLQVPLSSVYKYLYYACAKAVKPFTGAKTGLPKSVITNVNILANLAQIRKSRALEILQDLPPDSRLLRTLSQVAERQLSKPAKL